MESTELGTEAASQQPTYAFDIFLSYSRKDRNFAARLENALESYKFPRSLKTVKRNLNVFRDEADIQAGENYDRIIEQHLKGSAKLIVVCSPDARKSRFVEDEIRRFIQNHGEQEIIPVLVRGKANNETDDENEKAFPEVLCENRMPLAANFLGCNTHKGKLHKGPFSNSFYSVLAAIHGLDRRKLEQIDEKLRARRRALILSTASVIILILSVALVFAVISERKAVAATKKATESAESEKEARFKADESAAAEKKARKKADDSAEAEKIARKKADDSAEAEKKAKNEALAAAEAEKKAKNEAIASAAAETKAKDEAVAQRNAAEQLLYSANINLSRESYAAGNVKRSLKSLDSLLPASPDSEDRRGFEWHYLAGLYDRELAKFKVHDTAVTELAFSPNGRLLATGVGQTLRVWDAKSRTLVSDLGEPEGNMPKNLDVATVTSFNKVAIVFSPDNGVLLTATPNGRFRLWDTEKFKLLDTLEDAVKSDDFTAVSAAFSPDGRLFATGRGGIYKLWDTQTHKSIDRLNQEESPSDGNALTFSHDGKSLAFFEAPFIKVRDLANGSVTTINLANGTQVRTMVFSSDDKLIRIADQEGVKSFSVIGEKSDSFAVPRGTRFLGDSHSLVIAFSPDGRNYASAEGDILVYGGGVKLWDTTTHELLVTFPGLGTEGSVSSLAFSPDNKMLAVGGDKQVQFNDTDLHRNSVVFLNDQAVTFVGFSKDSDQFADIEETGTEAKASIRNTDSPTVPLNAIPAIREGSAAVSPDGRTLAVTTLSSVLLWNIVESKIVASIEMPKRQIYKVSATPQALAFSPDGHFLAIGVDDEQVQWWDLSTEHLIGEPAGVPGNVYASKLAFSPDGRYLAVIIINKDTNGLEIWDAVSHQYSGGITYDDSARPESLAFSADNKILVVGFANGVTQILNPIAVSYQKGGTSGRGRPISLGPVESARYLLSTLEGGSTRITSVACSPDNKTLATGSIDGTVKLWSRSSYQQLMSLDAGIKGVLSLTFSPNDETLVAGGENGIRIWHGLKEDHRRDNSIRPPN